MPGQSHQSNGPSGLVDPNGLLASSQQLGHEDHHACGQSHKFYHSRDDNKAGKAPQKEYLMRYHKKRIRRASMKRESGKIPLYMVQATKAGPREQVALADNTRRLREITACKQGVWKEFTVCDTSKDNTPSNNCNQRPNTLLIDLTLSDARTQKCLSKHTQHTRIIKREGDDHGYNNNASFPSPLYPPPPLQGEMTKGDKHNESLQDEAFLDDMEVLIPTHGNCSIAVESD